MVGGETERGRDRSAQGCGGAEKQHLTHPWEKFWRISGGEDRARRAVQQEKGVPGRGHSVSKGMEATEGCCL